MTNTDEQILDFLTIAWRAALADRRMFLAWLIEMAIVEIRLQIEQSAATAN